MKQVDLTGQLMAFRTQSGFALAKLSPKNGMGAETMGGYRMNRPTAGVVYYYPTLAHAVRAAVTCELNRRIESGSVGSPEDLDRLRGELTAEFSERLEALTHE